MISSAIPSVWIAAVALKVLVWLVAPDQVVLDRAINFGLLVLGAVTAYRVTTLARSGLLWPVSRQLILSYILVGAVPILLLATFSLLAFLLIGLLSTEWLSRCSQMSVRWIFSRTRGRLHLCRFASMREPPRHGSVRGT